MNLILIRHGQSEWNALNQFTGWKDPDLTAKGIEEAHNAGKIINNLKINFDFVFTSALIRAQNTAEIILEEINQSLSTIKIRLLMKETMEILQVSIRMMQEKDGVINKFIFGEDLMMYLLLPEKVLKIRVKECSHFL